MKVILLTFFIAVSLGSECQPVKCASSKQTLSTGECWVYDSDAYYLKQCRPLQQCTNLDSTQSGSGVGTCGTLAAFAADKEFCNGTSDCITTNLTSSSVRCTSGKCTGYLVDGSTCSETVDCQVGYYCSLDKKCTAQSNDGTCINLRVPGTSSCENDMTCVDGECQKYFKQDGGDNCNFWGDCKSGFCDPKQKRCAHEAPKSKNDPTQSCSRSSASACISHSYKNCDNEDDTFQVACNCGYSEHGHAYCEQQHPGDADAKEVAELYEEWVQNESIKICNADRKFEFNCLKTNASQKFWEEYIYFHSRVYNLNKVYDTDRCGGIVYAADYELAKAYLEDHDDLDDGGSDFGAVLVIIGAIMLF